MKPIAIAAALLLTAIPGFCEAPHRSLASLFNSSLAFAVPLPDSTPISTQVVTTSSNEAGIAPNTWIEIHGTNLAPLSDTWDNSDFTHGLPTLLDGVSATINNKPAAISYISSTQINVLAPIDTATGPVQVQVTTPSGTSAPISTLEQAQSLAFLIIDQPNHHVAAIHLNGTVIAPVGEFPGLTTLPAQPNEPVALYATGFGQPNPPITNQQTGTGQLPSLPLISIGGIPANVTYAKLAGPGLYQFNVTIPPNAPNGDLSVTCTYNGGSTQAGVVIAVQQ